MNNLNFSPYMYEIINRQHEELIKEAAQHRLVREAQKRENPVSRDSFNIFALIGRELSKIGFSLEVRYGQPEPNTSSNQQSVSEGCS